MFVLFYTGEKGVINVCAVLHWGEGGYKCLCCFTLGRRGLQMFVLFYTGEKGVISVCAVLHWGEGGYKCLCCFTLGRRGL